MFRVVLYVEDKKLGDVLRNLTGTRMEPPQFMVNAEVQKGKITAKSNGKLVTMFIDYLIKSKVQTIKPKQVREWLTTQGMSALSASYVQKQAMAAGVLKRTGHGSSLSEYTVQKLIAAPKKEGK
jgi:hypothetical protein